MKHKKIILKQKKPKNIKKFFWAGFVLILIVFSFVGYLFYSSFFKINQVNISGLKTIEKKEIEEIIHHEIQFSGPSLFSSLNIFIFNEAHARDKILNTYPGIRNANFKKILPSKLYIEIEEREKTAIYCQVEEIVIPEIKEDDVKNKKGENNNIIEEADRSSHATTTEDIVLEEQPKKIETKIKKCFYLDLDGTIFLETPYIIGSTITAIFSKADLKTGEKATNESILNFALKTKKIVEENSDFSIKNFSIDKLSPPFIEASTNLGFNIYFDTTKDALSQILVLKEVLDREINQKKSQLDYIDLRVGNKVFYKFRDKN